MMAYPSQFTVLDLEKTLQEMTSFYTNRVTKVVINQHASNNVNVSMCLLCVSPVTVTESHLSRPNRNFSNLIKIK